MHNQNLRLKIERYLIYNFNKIKIHSNDINNGEVFIALQGKNFHGSKFIDLAINRGAKYVVSDKKINKNGYKNILYVEDTFSYLKKIAIKKRDKFKGKIIAITGSVGKTSVKENLRFFLSFKLMVSASIKSYNNLLGIVVSLLNLNLDSFFGIFEIGTNNFNEISELTKIVKPHQVIITNIYATHLQSFQNTRNVAIEKSDLFNPKFNPNIELLILQNSNEDETYLKKLSKKYKIKNVFTFGKQNNLDYYIKSINIINNFLSIICLKTKNKFIEFKCYTSLEHQIINIIIPLIVFEFNNLKIDILLNKIKYLPQLEGRGLFHKLKIKDNTFILIDESYNASPVSMLNSINYFEKFKVKKQQKKILILGQMNELGKHTIEYHKEIMYLLLKTNIEKIIFCGNLYKKFLNQVQFNSIRFIYLPNEFEIIKLIEKIIHNNDIILAKGSNSTKINKLVNILLKNNREI